MVISNDKTFVYLDLEKYSDLNKLDDPELFFKNNREKNFCLDEIQRKPDLFKTLRSIIDEDRKNGRFLILGSASRELMQQSSETLAGRIGYIELTPFHYGELEKESDFNITRHWLRGGFPDSYLQSSDESSFIWRENFIRTFIERDLPQLGITIPALTIRRLLTMCAHNQGQVLNSSKLGDSLETSYHTIKNYLALLEQLFIIRILRPYYPNIKKRIIKSPKVYVRDSGILQSLLNIGHINDLLGHPVFGASWEGYCIENIIARFNDWEAYFYRTSSGNEIDLILEKGDKKVAIECKASTAPRVTKGIYLALDDLGIGKVWIIAPVDDTYELNERCTVSSLGRFFQNDYIK
jgi:predicted AAA+ superfamily ATPase